MGIKKCFADKGEDCSALTKKECKKCKFFRTDITRLDIEREIKKYGGTSKK